MKRNSEVWAPPCGGKRSRLFNRPLVPLLISFILGILITHEILGRAPGLPVVIFLFLAICLLLFPFLPQWPRACSLVLIFFLTGLLLGGKRIPLSRLAPLTDRGGQVIIEGTVLGPPRIIDDGRARFVLHARELILHRKTIPLDENVAVTVYGSLPALEPGLRIRFPARLRSFRNFNNFN